MNDSGICLEQLSLRYNEKVALNAITGCFPLAVNTAIVGPNGAGKSTLLKVIAGVLKPGEGAVHFKNCTQREIGYLPQRADVDRSFPLSVLDLVSMGAWKNIGGFGAAAKPVLAAVREALNRVGLADAEERFIGQLSVGQFQRALFARLIMQDARIILLDEPFAAIDTATTQDILQLIAGWHNEGRTVIAALHDLSQVRDYFPQALLLNGTMLGWGPAQKILQDAAHALIHLEAECGGETKSRRSSR